MRADARLGGAMAWTALALPLSVIAVAWLLVPALPHMFASLGYGHLSGHMAQHIATMNVIAPIVAYGSLRCGLVHRYSRLSPLEPQTLLAFAVTLQIAALWVWHAPGVFEWAMAEPYRSGLMHASLFLVALAFWTSVLGVEGHARWKPIIALLVTGKLFCLLGVLLIFAPRALYDLPLAHSQAAHALTASSLADQQLAGLLMVAVCPLTYIVAGVVIAARWVLDLEREGLELKSVARAGA